VLPQRVGTREHRCEVALPRVPVILIVLRVLILDRGREGAQPIAICRLREHGGEGGDDRLLLRIGDRARIPVRAEEELDRLTHVVPRSEVEREELSAHVPRTLRELIVQRLIVRVELRRDVRATLERSHPLAVAALEERHLRGVVGEHRVAVQPEIDVFARLDRPRRARRSGLRRRRRQRVARAHRRTRREQGHAAPGDQRADRGHRRLSCTLRRRPRSPGRRRCTRYRARSACRRRAAHAAGAP